MKGRVAIVGAGRAGSAVARALREAGMSIDAVISSTGRSARNLARELNSPVSGSSIEALPTTLTLLVLAVPDGVISRTAAQLARLPLPWSRITVMHLSGALGRNALTPLARRGARTLAIHPAFPFTSRKIAGSQLAGIGWGVECMPQDWGAARKLVTAMRGHPVRVPAHGRLNYHAACALISNYTVTLAATAEQVALDAGLKRRDAALLLNTLLQTTVSGFTALDHRTLRAALTGPASRGDATVVGQHLRALRANTNARSVYLALARQTVEMLIAEDPSVAKNMRALKVLLDAR